MAAIETTGSDKYNHKIRLKKKSTSIDLTPMVDLGFLLITFFVFTTTMSKPTVMKVDIPNDTSKENNPVCNSCALTVLLGKDNVLQYYEGDFTTAHLQSANYNSIRNIILEKKKKVQQVRGNADQFVLIIKPTTAASFKNFVDITDEVTINLVKRYYIDEITTAEQTSIDDPIQLRL